MEQHILEVKSLTVVLKNYRLNGVSRRYCLDNGQWSDATPKCEGDYFRIRVIYFIFNDDI